MRFLADTGISPKTVDFLKQLGHDATHIRTLGLQRAPDARIVDRARTDGSIVLSFDLDFGDILALGVMDKPSAIIFRLADERTESVNARLKTVLTERRRRTIGCPVSCAHVALLRTRQRERAPRQRRVFFNRPACSPRRITPV